MNEDVERYRRFAKDRVRQLAFEDAQLRRWLSQVRLVGFPMQILSLVCPVAAGSVSLASVLDVQAKIWIAVLSFLGAATVALHRGLHCEKYQEALRRTIQTVLSILEDFETIEAIPDDEVAAAFKAAEGRLRELRTTSSDLPPKHRSLLRDAEAGPDPDPDAAPL